MNQNDQIKYEKYGMTHNQIVELKAFLVERQVDNMETKDLVSYVTDDLDRYYENMPDAEFIAEAKEYWEDYYEEIVEEVKEYVDCDFKKPIEERHPYLDSLSEGKDTDDYGSKVDALVDSMGVTDKEVSTIHRRKDMDLL